PLTSPADAEPPVIRPQRLAMDATEGAGEAHRAHAQLGGEGLHGERASQIGVESIPGLLEPRRADPARARMAAQERPEDLEGDPLDGQVRAGVGQPELAVKMLRQRDQGTRMSVDTVVGQPAFVSQGLDQVRLDLDVEEPRSSAAHLPVADLAGGMEDELQRGERDAGASEVLVVAAAEKKAEVGQGVYVRRGRQPAAVVRLRQEKGAGAAFPAVHAEEVAALETRGIEAARHGTAARPYATALPRRSLVQIGRLVRPALSTSRSFRRSCKNTPVRGR